MQSNFILKKVVQKRQKSSKLFLLLFCMPFLGFGQSITPATLNVAGNTFQNSVYQFEWSFGEMAVIETFRGNNTSIITSGVLQPVTMVVEPSSFFSYWLSDEVKLFPNPTNGMLNVNILATTPGQMNILLTSANGQLLANKSFYYNGLGRIEQFNLAKYAAGQYIVSIELKPPLSGIKKSGFKITKYN